LERALALLARRQADRKEWDAAAADPGPVPRVSGGAVIGPLQDGFVLHNRLPAGAAGEG
jgi:hypothetical protein